MPTASRVISFLGVLFAALTVVVLLLWVFQERVVFQPPTPMARSARGEFVEFKTPEGQSLHAYIVLPPVDTTAARRGALVFFHGNGDLAENRMDWAEEAARRAHLPIVLAEYRGYGGLSGRPTYEDAITDAIATVAMVKARFAVENSDLILYGHSLGTGVASQLTVEQGARTLMLECPYTSMIDMGRNALLPPISWALPFIMRVKFAPLAMVQKSNVPVWVAVAGQDEVIPPVMAHAVFNAARSKGEFLDVPKAGHTDLPDAGGARYWEWFTRATAPMASRL